MCSIGGAVFKHPVSKREAKRIAQILLFFGRERGDQSAGLWVDGEKTVLKRAIEVSEFLDTKAFDKLWERHKEVRAFLTHTRLPTSGGRTDSDAQPFKADDTVSVHNGHVLNPEQLEKKFDFSRVTQVDSEVFARFIGKYGTRTLPQFLKMLSGSAAVACWHQNQMYAFRSNNPIKVAKIKDWGIIFGSTEEMVKYAVVAIFGYFPASCTFASLPEDEVLRLNGDGTVEKVATFATAPFSYTTSWDDEGSRYGRIIRTNSIVDTTTTPTINGMDADARAAYNRWLNHGEDDEIVVIERPATALARDAD